MLWNYLLGVFCHNYSETEVWLLAVTACDFLSLEFLAFCRRQNWIQTFTVTAEAGCRNRALEVDIWHDQRPLTGRMLSAHCSLTAWASITGLTGARPPHFLWRLCHVPTSAWSKSSVSVGRRPWWRGTLLVAFLMIVGARGAILAALGSVLLVNLHLVWHWLASCEQILVIRESGAWQRSIPLFKWDIFPHICPVWAPGSDSWLDGWHQTPLTNILFLGLLTIRKILIVNFVIIND